MAKVYTVLATDTIAIKRPGTVLIYTYHELVPNEFFGFDEVAKLLAKTAAMFSSEAGSDVDYNVYTAVDRIYLIRTEIFQ